MLIDSHCHLEMTEFDPDRADVIARARAAGVGFILSIGDGSDPQAMARSIELSETHEFIATSVGIHPHQASLFDEVRKPGLEEASRHDKVIGWGEVGLDYHYNLSPPEKQRIAFDEQVQMALDRGLPLIVHSRKADEDTRSILARHCPPGRLNGVMHCFTGGPDFALQMIELGFMISFSGIVTFPKAGEIRDAAQKVPQNMILVETDAPYLAPVPHRGKRNEPAFVVDTAGVVARIRGLDPERIADVTTANFRRLFTKAIHHVRSLS